MAALLVTRLRQTPAAQLDRAAPRIGSGAHALGDGLLAVFGDEQFLEFAPHHDDVDDDREQIHVQERHQDQRDLDAVRDLPGEGRDDDGQHEDDERDGDEELADVESGVHIVAHIDAPGEAFGLWHVLQVAGAHRLVFAVFAFTHALLRRLALCGAVLRHERSDVLRLRLLAFRRRTSLAALFILELRVLAVRVARDLSFVAFVLLAVMLYLLFRPDPYKDLKVYSRRSLEVAS